MSVPSITSAEPVYLTDGVPNPTTPGVRVMSPIYRDSPYGNGAWVLDGWRPGVVGADGKIVMDADLAMHDGKEAVDAALGMPPRRDHSQRTVTPPQGQWVQIWNRDQQRWVTTFEYSWVPSDTPGCAYAYGAQAVRIAAKLAKRHGMTPPPTPPGVLGPANAAGQPKSFLDQALPGGKGQGYLYLTMTFVGIVAVLCGTQHMPAWWCMLLLLLVGSVGGTITYLAFKYPRVAEAAAYGMSAYMIGHVIHKHHQRQQANMIADAINRRS